jgi:hypothetical protein
LGFGAEFCRPNNPSDAGLLRALLRPECAFANGNSAVLSATEALAVIKATCVQYDAADQIIGAVNTASVQISAGCCAIN